MQEKFLSLRYDLCGIRSYGQDATNDIVEEARTFFRQLQLPFTIVTAFSAERTSFPNYNFAIRRIWDLIGFPEFGHDFPPLKSKKKRQEIIGLWLPLITYLQWPYINSDGALFGPDHETRLAELQRRRRAPKRAAPTETPDPEPDNHKLRRTDDDSSNGPRDWGTIDSLMCWISGARDDPGNCGNSGTDNGNCSGASV